jgi:predicted DNA binding CopG/RHH family protein
MSKEEQEELEVARRLEADFRSGRQSDWVSATGQEAEQLDAIHKDFSERYLKRRGGRPKSKEALSPVFMKWPESLLADVKTEADRINIGYQAFIKMVVTESIERRRKERG